MIARHRPDVKPKRTYDSSGRREQARQTRGRIIDTAERMFLRDGYSATTVQAIAAVAGVSADTIYKSFGGKPGLIRAIRDYALHGEGPIPAERRSDAIQQQEGDPRAIITAWGDFVAELAPRGSPILLLIRNVAASDPEVRALHDELDAARLKRMTTNARRLRDAGHLRPGISLAHAADILWTYSSPELYELFVLRRGWTPERYGRYVAEAMISALL
ncbi:MAG: TetR/AcrR family transcriptional regulator [Solirubrobacterales bacterium]|nr:TetR/AcrR family transcriptional regulator [Solirubrobacterales bacterium]MBV9364055.1 TetR/AcrR family transcriptional regulator [Solirubrobacterales bacterium]